MTQAEITQNIKDIVSEFKTSGLSRIFEILEWIHKNLKANQDKEYKDEYFRSRTSDEIIKSKALTGCTDYALVFLSLIRASGFEAKYVEAIETEWLKNDGDDILGHVFAEVLFNNNWLIVDPQGATIKAWYGKRYAIYAKGEDSWDLGIRNFDDLKNEFIEYRKSYINKNE